MNDYYSSINTNNPIPRMDIEFYDPFTDPKYKGFAGRFRRSRIAGKEYLRRPYWISVLIFTVIAASLSVLLYSVKDEVMGYITQILNSILGDVSVNENGVISPLSLFLNNLRAACTAFALGFIPFIYAPTLSLVINAIAVGIIPAFVGYSMNFSLTNSILYTLIGILPHGIFELTAIFMGISMGYATCTQLNRAILHKKGKWPFDFYMGEICWHLVLYIIPLLLIAAFMEAYVTPICLSAFLQLVL